MCPKSIEILIADDDADDRMLIMDALKESNILNNIQAVEDGEQLMQLLRNEGIYTDKEQFPLPGIILLDLNMPRMDGREALKAIKADKQLCSIPIIVFSTSIIDEDIKMAYSNGANSFISKPVTFSSMIDVMKTLSKYWLNIVELPNTN